MKKLIGALCLAVVMTACAGSPVARQSPSAQPSPSASLSASPSPSPSAAPTPAPPAGFVAASFSGGSVAGSSVATVRVGQHDGYDRFVIEFAGGVPAYTVTPQSTAQFTRSPKGDVVTLAGTAGVLIVVHSVTNWSTYGGPTAFQPTYPYLRQAVQVENFEGYQQWALGIQGTPYLRVFTLSSPNCLVVDVAAL